MVRRSTHPVFLRHEQKDTHMSDTIEETTSNPPIAEQIVLVTGGARGLGLSFIRAASAGFAQAGSGRMINIGTTLFQNPVVFDHDSTAAKAALLSLTRTFAADLAPCQVGVNMLSGGLLRTTDAGAATPAEVFDGIAAGTAPQRVTTPEEFADPALFLASPWSRAVTGQNLVVGGLVRD